MEIIEPLAVRWFERWDEMRHWMALGLVFVPVGERLLARYSEPGRHYHDGRHILSCLSALDDYSGGIGDNDAVELAIWFHDAICDTSAPPGDNEARSADYFRSEFQALGAGLVDIDRVGRLILATRHNAIADDSDAALVMDIDLGVLGAAPARYAIYAEDIRKEYADVEDSAFRAGRAAVLRSFLARDSIYSTRHFRKLLEENARHNLLEELRTLESQ